ncbi:hypothetical protein ACFQ51_50915 [Streptomyces kaempferi]
MRRTPRRRRHPATPRRPAHLRLPTPRYWPEFTRAATAGTARGTTDGPFWDAVEQGDVTALTAALDLDENAVSRLVPALAHYRRTVPRPPSPTPGATASPGSPSRTDPPPPSPAAGSSSSPWAARTAPRPPP